MKFYFDESGNYDIPNDSNIHKASVVMGVTISELIEDELKSRFQKLTANLSSEEYEKGEPKGYLLSPNSRLKFCDLLADLNGVSLTPVTLDLSSLRGTEYLEELPQKMRDLLYENAKKCIYRTMQDDVKLLGRRFSNLSIAQSLRIYSWANCFREALYHAILFLSIKGHENYWDNLRFEIDRVQIHHDSREKQVFSYMLMMWLVGWSVSKPLELIKEIHTPNHPFVIKYDLGYGVDIGKMIKGNLYWVNSKDSWGLQIADIASNIVYNAVNDLNNRNGNISLLVLLMRKSFYGPIRGPGLFTPLKEVPEETRKKYVLLYRMLKSS